jgi:hypothetical protein
VVLVPRTARGGLERNKAERARPLSLRRLVRRRAASLAVGGGVVRLSEAAPTSGASAVVVPISEKIGWAVSQS